MVMKYNFEMHQGDSERVLVQIVDSECEALDLTNILCTCQLRNAAGELVAEAEDYADIINKVYGVEFQPEDTKELVPEGSPRAVYFYDFQTRDLATGYIKTLLKGRVTVYPEITL